MELDARVSVLERVPLFGGLDAEALQVIARGIAAGDGAVPTRAMVAYVHYAIQHDGPYAMLGMVHVLEGLSAALASIAAERLQASLGCEGGFTYLRSHGRLDQAHVGFFRKLADGAAEPRARRAIVETAKAVYRLYGDIFREIDALAVARRHAA